MTHGTNRYEAFEVVHTANGAGAALSDAELLAEQHLREKENVFPLEVFHPTAQHFMKEIHQNMKVPRSFLGLTMLSAYSAAIGTSYAVDLSGEMNYMVIWSCLVGDSSTGKSIAMKRCFKPLFELQKQFDQENADNDKEFKRMRNEDRMMENVVPDHLRVPDIFVQNSHINTLMKDVLPNNPKGVTMQFEEILEWINGMNSNNGKEGIEEQVYLRGWSGSDFRGHRAGGKVWSVPRIYTSVYGGTQPQVAYKLFKNDRDVTGFIFRILFTDPEDQIVIPEPNWRQSKEIEDSHANPIKLMYTSLNVRSPFEEPRVIQLSKKAANMHFNWKKERAQKINAMSDRASASIHNGIFGKIGEYIIRFCGLLAVSDLAYNGKPLATHVEVNADYMQRAIKLGEYFYESAWKTYQLNNKSIYIPEDVLRWAVYFRSGKTYVEIAWIEYGSREPSAAKKASRQMKKHITKYPKAFGANAK